MATPSDTASEALAIGNTISPPKQRLDTTWQDMDKLSFYAYGAGVSLLASASVFPLSVVRVRQQIDTSKDASNSVRHMLRSIVRNEGVRGLYRGFHAVALGNVATEALYLSTYELARQHLIDRQALDNEKARAESGATGAHEPSATHSALQSFASGVIAETVATGTSLPFDIISLRMMATSNSYRNIVDASRQIYRADGVKGFYRGLGVSYLRNAPDSAIWWSSYAYTKARLGKLLPADEAEAQKWLPLVFGASGAVAGLSSALLTAPLDVIKTRLQTQDFGALHTAQQDKYRNALDAFTQILRKEGVQAFTKGMLARAMSGSIASAINLTAYEYLKKWAIKSE